MGTTGTATTGATDRLADLRRRTDEAWDAWVDAPEHDEALLQRYMIRQRLLDWFETRETAS